MTSRGDPMVNNYLQVSTAEIFVDCPEAAFNLEVIIQHTPSVRWEDLPPENTFSVSGGDGLVDAVEGTGYFADKYDFLDPGDRATFTIPMPELIFETLNLPLLIRDQSGFASGTNEPEAGDELIWRVLSAGQEADGSANPEPTTLCLLGAGALVLCSRRRD